MFMNYRKNQGDAEIETVVAITIVGIFSMLIFSYSVPCAKKTKLYVAKCQFYLGKYDKAGKIYEEIMEDSEKKDEFYQDALQNLAAVEENTGEYLKAIASYRSLINLKKKEEDKIPLYIEQARVYQKNDDWEQALGIYEELMESSADPQTMEIIEKKFRLAKNMVEKEKSNLGPNGINMPIN